MKNYRLTTSLAALALGLALPVATSAQPVIQENFDSVTGIGGGEFFVGAGEGVIEEWDTGLLGENAFAGATVRAFSHASATGDPVAGVAGSGAGVISVSDVTFNPLHLDFRDVSGNPGGGVFMDSISGTEGFTANWDNKITGEAAFGGIVDGATLNGTMSAQAIPGSGYARLDVVDVNVGAGSWYAGLMFAAPALEGSVVLGNPGFDDGPTLEPWSTWSNVFSEPGANPDFPFTPHSGERAMKMFGPFTGSPNSSGAYQELPAEPTQTWELDCFVQHLSADAITGTLNYVEMSIEFRDAGDVVIGTSGVVILDGTSPTDTWIDVPVVQAVAPAGTAAARAVITFYQPGVGIYEGGAALIDDVRFEVVAGPPQSAVDLNAISLSATVRGTVDAAGETLGDYQLRIEDGEGDRLVFSGTADGSWQSIGGPLSAAVETDNTGVPASGVFNTAAAAYTVVLTFDNDTTVTWGTGGTLELDEVILSGTDPLDSNWYGGLFWNDLLIANPDLDALSLTADVKGDTSGGEYVLRLEGFVVNSNGVDEAFTDVTGAGNQLMVSYDMTTSGVTSGWSNNWDTGLLGEAAFGGLDTGSVFCSSSECPGVIDVGISAKGLMSGGNPGACAQLKITGIWVLTPGGDWWGGLMWQDQALASSDLSQVELKADVKGLADPFLGEQLGSIELRIEDEDGDRLYKHYTATSAWQTIGGTLDTFTEAGPASGVGGSGAFDTDHVNYTVVIAFDQPYTTWVWGGTILADNVFLTPAEVAVELGRVSFDGVADGSFQSVGGMLSAGDSTFVTDLEEDMESAAGDSLNFWPGDWGGPDFDSGLMDDAYFGGTWGSGGLASATAQTCTTCGFGGSKAIEFIVGNPTGARWSGGWWTGIAFNDQRLEIDDLSNIVMTAKIKGVPAAGGQQGTVSFKLEDPNLDAMEFLVVTDGTWQTVGGPLSDAAMVAGGDTSQGADGVFDVNAPWYKVVVVSWGPTPTGTPGVDPDWNSSHTVTVDDVFLTRPGRSIADAERFTVTLAFGNELATWGTSGTLTLDNLAFGVLGSADFDGDGDVDLADFAVFQTCFGGAAIGACENTDINGDSGIDVLDLGLLTAQMDGPQ